MDNVQNCVSYARQSFSKVRLKHRGSACFHILCYNYNPFFVLHERLDKYHYVHLKLCSAIDPDFCILNNNNAVSDIDIKTIERTCHCEVDISPKWVSETI
jgi:hypothetical protein